ncbi:MAG TPA: SET domain-containing protein-lysine N-methyltransferase [Acidimicrobiales bacterium]|nr:SET domain-containing protein-lysine N-methyltransferase [Acidimicrobiales bacterium]
MRHWLVSDATPPSTPWVHEAVVAGDSAIAGKGLFARTALEDGTVVIRVGGRLVGTAELRRLIETSEHYVDTVTVFEDVHLVLPPATAVHYGNHSCDPNLWHVDAYEIATRRPVPAGEELTMDYATQTGAPGFSMLCRCGAADCRGEVTSEDWRRADLQARYAGHWVPALGERISRGG